MILLQGLVQNFFDPFRAVYDKVGYLFGDILFVLSFTFGSF